MRHERSLLGAPVFRALAIQFLSFLIVLGLAVGVVKLANFSIPIAMAAVMQGLLAMIISKWRGLPVWWWGIQFFLPVSLLAMLSLDFPPSVFLFAFILSIGLYWTTFRTQVPFYPSRLNTWDKVADLLPQDRPIQFIDIGSGMGGLVMHLAQRRPESVFTGIEIAPLLWLVSCMRARITNSKGRFIRGDYGALNFADYDVVFAFLSPAAMPYLWDKARAEMRPGTLLLSYEFTIPGAVPDITTTLDDRGAAIFGWQI